MTVCVMFVNVIALLLEMSSAFALAAVVLRVWAIFVPMEVTTSETWRRGDVAMFWIYSLALV
jgi:hypothetical protein